MSLPSSPRPAPQPGTTAPPAPISVEVVADLAGLRTLKADWDRLLGAYATPSVFLSHGYACAWWQAFGDASSLRVMVCRAGGRVIGIAPLMQSLWRYRGLPIRRLGPFHNHHTLRADLLLPERAGACLAALLADLRRRRDWDVLSLENVPPGSPLHGLLESVAAAEGLRHEPWRPGRTHWLLPLAGDWDAHLRARSKKFRSELRRYRRRLDALGDARFLRVDTTAGQLDLLPRLFELERRSWKARDSRVATDAADRRFARLLVEELDDHRGGETWVLERAGRLLASFSLLAEGRVLYAVTTFYDEACGDLAPGHLLLAELLPAVWDGRFDALDFNGDTPFIRRWATQAVPHVRTRVYAGSPYGRLLFRMGRLAQGARRWLHHGRA